MYLFDPNYSFNASLWGTKVVKFVSENFFIRHPILLQPLSSVGEDLHTILQIFEAKLEAYGHDKMELEVKKLQEKTEQSKKYCVAGDVAK